MSAPRLAGETIEAANQDLEDAIESWVELELERGHDIPEPLVLDAYPGRMQVRIPPSLHRRAQLVAHLEGVSLNRLMSEGIALVVGERASGAQLAATDARREIRST